MFGIDVFRDQFQIIYFVGAVTLSTIDWKVKVVFRDKEPLNYWEITVLTAVLLEGQVVWDFATCRLIFVINCIAVGTKKTVREKRDSI
jgi:hypothetical protein